MPHADLITITRWIMAEGERVEKGKPLLEVETEKVQVEVESPASGVLRKILAPAGSLVPVGQLIAIITEPEEMLPPEEKILKREGPASAPTREVREAEEPTTRVAEEGVRISPLARKLAKQHEIEVGSIHGTGPEGRIVEVDVIRAVEAEKATQSVLVSPQPTEPLKVSKIIPLLGIRKTVADRVSRSYREAVHVAITVEVDMTETMVLRQTIASEEIGEKGQVNPSYTDVLVKAAAAALKRHPIINSTLEDDRIKIIADINIGLAVAVEDGLIVPVVRNADRKSLAEIALSLEDLTERARQNRLRPDDVSGGTFTISNLGMFGVDAFRPIINPPQSAILGVGTIKERPVVVSGQIVKKPMMTLTLVFDHRVFDGVPAAVYLKTLKEILESPQT